MSDDGWVVADALFTPAECDAIVAAGERRRWPDVPPDLLAWIIDVRWADLVLAAVGPDARFFREQVVSKQPGVDDVVPWHQDHAYAPLQPAFVTCFVALDEITPANGCLWLRPRSHEGGPAPHVPAGAIQRLRDDGDEGVPVPLTKGSVVAFSSLTHHRSGPNDTTHVRRAWVVQHCPADAVHLGTGSALDDRLRLATGGRWDPRLPVEAGRTTAGRAGGAGRSVGS